MALRELGDPHRRRIAITGLGMVTPVGNDTCSTWASLRAGKSGAGESYIHVEVDRETGKVDIVRYTAIQDVGKAIYPPYVEGQIQGGVAQGYAMAFVVGIIVILGILLSR